MLTLLSHITVNVFMVFFLVVTASSIIIHGYKQSKPTLLVIALTLTLVVADLSYGLVECTLNSLASWFTYYLYDIYLPSQWVTGLALLVICIRTLLYKLYVGSHLYVWGVPLNMELPLQVKLYMQVSFLICWLAMLSCFWAFGWEFYDMLAELVYLPIVEMAYGKLCSIYVNVETVCSFFIEVLSPKVIICDSYIPWHHTGKLNNGILALNRMYKTLPEGSIYKSYITENCSHLLSPLKGYTPIPMEMVDPTFLSTHPGTVDLGSYYKREYTAGLKGRSGVYLFFRDSIDYCGSCNNFDSRLSAHYALAKKLPLKHPIFKIPVESFQWNPIHTVTNYKLDFYYQFGETSPQVEEILSSFLEQEIRSLEQAVASTVKPTFYDRFGISTDHNKWQPGDLAGKVSTVWTTATGESYEVDSITQAADRLGVARSTLRTAVQSSLSVNSPKYGSVVVETITPTVDLSTVFLPPVKLVENTLFEYSQLPTDGIYLVNEDMTLSANGPYSNVTELKNKLGVAKQVKASRYINMLKLIEVPLLGASYFLVQRAKNN